MAAIIPTSNKSDEFIFCFNAQRFLLPSLQLDTFNFRVGITAAAAGYWDPHENEHGWLSLNF